MFSLLLAANACDRSVQFILRGNYAAALKQLDGAKSSGESPADRENLRGLALLLSGDVKKALASFEKALALDPKLAEARLNRGIALLRTNAPAKASSDFQQIFADEHSALRATAAYHNALALDALGRASDAEAWLDKSRALDPSLDAALLYSGMLRERRGDLQGAGRAYLAYLEKHPDTPAALLRFGIAAQRSGHADTAKRYLQRVIDADPESAEATEARKFLVLWE